MSWSQMDFSNKHMKAMLNALQLDYNHVLHNMNNISRCSFKKGKRRLFRNSLLKES